MLIDKALSSDKPNGHWFEADWLHCKRDALSRKIERLMVRGSQVAVKHVIHGMETRTLVMELRRCAIKRWVPCGDMDSRLNIPHSAKTECGFRTTPEECLYDSGPIGPSVHGLIIQLSITRELEDSVCVGDSVLYLLLCISKQSLISGVPLLFTSFERPGGKIDALF